MTPIAADAEIDDHAAADRPPVWAAALVISMLATASWTVLIAGAVFLVQRIG